MITMKNSIFLLLLFVVYTIEGSPLSTYGIFGGQDAVEGQFPYQVSLQIDSWPFGYQHYCGGSIISPNWIVTAGHCCWTMYPSLHVVAGILKVHDQNEYTQVRLVEERYIHENYTYGVQPNDICVIKVNESWVFNDRVKPIALPIQDFNAIGKGVSSGWGQSAGNLFPQFPDTLQWQESEIPDEETCLELCNKAEKLNPYNTTSNICTANPEQNHGTCEGDSGGPLVLDEQLVGLASWVFLPCGREGAPSVFTRVSHFVDWIKKHDNEL
ncbi:trypsin-1-like [Diabrotica undecimpunctata]|uniref:trypsin-1-like n=1 Tax=Diabrotica undecimpunctata TaxID=50387 RepID=UPI003B6333F4